MNSRADPAELADLKARTPLSEVFARFGVRARGSRKAQWAACCFHAEKTPSLKINDERGTYHCFGCGASGDHFDALRELAGKTFGEAVEVLGGTRLVTVEERRAIEEREAQWRQEEQEKRAKTATSMARLFTEAKGVNGTHAAAYLEARGLTVVSGWTFDLRFVPALSYRGFADSQADETVELGAFPAMVAAIRDAAGTLIGLHRTYLDPARPAKLDPPGDKRRNKAKKVMGEQRGGMIRLSAAGRRLALGEGIETSRSWYALGLGGDDVAVAAAVSIGNLSGGATGSAPHPTADDRRIPNGKPDLGRPGIVLPRDVDEVVPAAVAAPWRSVRERARHRQF